MDLEGLVFAFSLSTFVDGQKSNLFLFYRKRKAVHHPLPTSLDPIYNFFTQKKKLC